MPAFARAHLLCPAALLLASLAAPGCVGLHFQNDDYSRFREQPPAVAPEDYAEGSPRYVAVVEGVFTSFDGAPLAPDPEVSAYLTGLLRRARAFQSVRLLPSGQAAPAAAARVRAELRFTSASHMGENLAKSLVPGAVAHRYDLASTAKLLVVLPASEEPRVYEVRTSASRYYYTAGHMENAKRVLLQQVGDANLQGLIDQVLLEPELRAP